MKKIKRSLLHVNPYVQFTYLLRTVVVMMFIGIPITDFVPQSQLGALYEMDDSSLPLNSPNADADGGTIFISETINGVIDDESDADVFQFQGIVGESVSIKVDATSDDLNPAVTLFYDASRLFPNASQSGYSNYLNAHGFLSVTAPQTDVFVEIDSPLDGASIPIPADPTNILVTGKAGVTGTGSATNLEVAIVIDVSGSIDSSEYDLEAAGVRAILDALDPDGDGTLSSPVALIQFSTEAKITAPLTRNRAQVEIGLSREWEQNTYYDNAFQKALDALAPSSASDNVAELVLFFSDGAPSSGTYTPPGQGGPLDQFQPNGIRMDTFGIGGGVDVSILTAVAQATGGTYTPIPTFNDIPNVTASLPGLAGLQSVVIDTNGDGIGDVAANVAVDGSFTAIVPINVGRNTITAIATATDTNLSPASSTIIVFGILGAQVGNNIGIIHDDDSGSGTDALIEVFRLPFTGSYTLLVASSESASSGDYSLALKPIDEDSNVAAISLGANYIDLINTQTGSKVFGSGSGWTFTGFSPDGMTAAISLGTNYVDLINTQTGQKAFGSGSGWTFTGFSPDGQTAAISLGTNYVDLINTETGQKVFGSGSGWTFTAFSPDGKTAAISLGTNYVDLINTETGDKVFGSGSGWTFMGFSPDGKTAAVSLGTNYVDLINTETGQKVFGSGSGWTFTAFSPDGKTAAISLGTNYVDLINTETGQKVFGSGSGWTFSGFSPDGKTAAISLGTNYVDLINSESGQKVFGSGSGWTFSGFSPDGETAAISLGTNYVDLISTRTGQKVFGSGSGWTFSAFSPGGEVAAISLGTDYVDLINTATGQKVFGSGSGWTFSAFSPGWKTAAISMGTNYVDLINIDTGSKVFGSGSGWTFTAFSPDGKTTAISMGTNYIDFINTESGQKIFGSGSGWTFSGFSPDGKTAAISMGTNYVDLINTESGQKVFGSGSGWTFSGFNPDGETASISLGTNYVDLISTRTGQKRFGSGSGWTLAGFSLDGDTAVVTLGGNYVDLINTRSGQKVFGSGSGWTFTAFSFDRTQNVATHTAYNLHAPMLMHGKISTAPAGGINGSVTHNGAVASGIELRLRHYDGVDWSTALTTTTSSDGSYLFTGASSLGQDEKYYVRYGPNSVNDQYLYEWFCPDIASYTAGESASGGDFDIANVDLVSPESYDTESLPVTFTWQRRGLSGDTYVWRLFYFVGNSISDDWQTDDLGDVGSYTLTTLPSWAWYDEEYGWDVFVYNGSDSFGTSFYYHSVYFSTTTINLPSTSLQRRLEKKWDMESIFKGKE